MRLIPTNIKKRPLKALWSALWPVLVLGYIIWIFSGAISPKTALASNNYIDNIVFYKNADGYNHISFHCKTSFTSTDWDSFGRIYLGETLLTNSFPCIPHRSWVAGNNYDYKSYTSGYNQDEEHCPQNNPDNATYTTANYIKIAPQNDGGLVFSDAEEYYFSEYPTLTITYPEDNDEIAVNFYITGSWTQPSPYPYHWLLAYFNPVGWEFTNTFGQTISIGGVGVASGTINIWVNALPKGLYDFEIYMLDYENNYITFPTWNVSDINIVEDLPFGLPPYGEGEPYYPPAVYNPLEPTTYYQENSTYATSTALYSTLTGVLAPMLLGIGNNLTQYSANFTPSNASSTGNQLGQSVVLLRSYLSNLNSFFNGFPVSQFLILYLIALLLAIVLRLVKNLIHLGKPI